MLALVLLHTARSAPLEEIDRCVQGDAAACTTVAERAPRELRPAFHLQACLSGGSCGGVGGDLHRIWDACFTGQHGLCAIASVWERNARLLLEGPHGSGPLASTANLRGVARIETWQDRVSWSGSVVHTRSVRLDHSTMAVLDEAGDTLWTLRGEGFVDAALSPNGQQVALITRTGDRLVWVFDLAELPGAGIPDALTLFASEPESEPVHEEWTWPPPREWFPEGLPTGTSLRVDAPRESTTYLTQGSVSVVEYGPFERSDLAPGPWIVDTNRASWDPAGHRVVLDRSTSALHTVELTKGERTVLVPVLEPTVTVRGRVVREDGWPAVETRVEGTWVYDHPSLRTPTPSLDGLYAETDLAGRFEATGLLGERWLLHSGESVGVAVLGEEAELVLRPTWAAPVPGRLRRGAWVLAQDSAPLRRGDRLTHAGAHRISDWVEGFTDHDAAAEIVQWLLAAAGNATLTRHQKTLNLKIPSSGKSRRDLLVYEQDRYRWALTPSAATPSGGPYTPVTFESALSHLCSDAEVVVLGVAGPPRITRERSTAGFPIAVDAWLRGDGPDSLIVGVRDHRFGAPEGVIVESSHDLRLTAPPGPVVAALTPLEPLPPPLDHLTHRFFQVRFTVFGPDDVDEPWPDFVERVRRCLRQSGSAHTERSSTPTQPQLPE
ncbi:MAG: hypothetical protein R3F61_01455 [Myxococcota bacterium]